MPARIDSLDKKLKKQNPEALADKVANFDEMEAALARLDRFDLTRTPNFEPRRGADGADSMSPRATAPLLYLPIQGGPEAAVCDWLAALDGGGPLIERVQPESLRQWRRPARASQLHRAASPGRARPCRLLRAGSCASGPGTFAEIRAKPGPDRSSLVLPGCRTTAMRTAHRAAFLGFLRLRSGPI